MQPFWIVMFIGILSRVLFWFTSWNSGGDALARIAYTAAWLEHPSLRIDFNPWLPLHFWMIGALAWVVGDVSAAGRLLSLLAGIGSLFVFWRLACQLFEHRAALLSLFVFAVYSLHIGYSTNSSSEATFLFFVLTGLVGFFSYRRSRRLSHLAGSGLSLTLAAAIRYEGWILIAALGLCLLWTALRSLGQPGFQRALLVFGLTAGIWPAIWMAYQWSTVGQPLYSLTKNSEFFEEYVARSRSPLWYQLTLPVGTLFLTLSPLPFAASLYGIYLALKHGNGAEYGLLVPLLAVAQYITPPHMVFARYTITLGTMLAIVSGFGAEEFRRRLPEGYRRQFPLWFAGTALFSLMVVLLMSESNLPFSNKFRSISPRPLFVHELAGVGDFLKTHLRPAETVVVDDYNEDGGTITYLAGLGLGRTERAFLWSHQMAAGLEIYVEEHGPRYVVYTREGSLPTRMELPRDCVAGQIQTRKASFRCVYENRRYLVYEMTH